MERLLVGSQDTTHERVSHYWDIASRRLRFRGRGARTGDDEADGPQRRRACIAVPPSQMTVTCAWPSRGWTPWSSLISRASDERWLVL